MWRRAALRQGCKVRWTIAICRFGAQVWDHLVTVRKVLVTGASGFVGSHVVQALQGHVEVVRAMVRETSETGELQRAGVKLCVGSLDDGEALRRAVSGVDAVIHLAALTHARTENELQRVNAGGTAALLQAIHEAEDAPLRFVYLSSLAAAGPSTDARPITTEDAPRPLTAYGRSKLAGEVAVRQRSNDVETITLRAPAVYGPGDRELLRFFKMAKLGALPIPGGPDRPLQLIHVQDLARGLVDAVKSEGLRGTYNVADAHSYMWRDVCRMIGDAVGTMPVFIPVPQTAIAFAAAVSETITTALGGSTMFNRDKVRELLAAGWLCETESARNAFGFEARIKLADGLRATADWYRNKGWL